METRHFLACWLIVAFTLFFAGGLTFENLIPACRDQAVTAPVALGIAGMGSAWAIATVAVAELFKKP